MGSQATGGRAPHPYRGEDRRRVAAAVQSPFGIPYLLAVLFTLVVAWAVSLVSIQGPLIGRVQLLVPLLQTMSFVLAVAVGAIAISRWYLTSDAPALWIGVALLVYGFARLAVAELVPFVLGGGASWAAWVRPASLLLVVILLARAATIVPVSSVISGPKLMLGALALLLLLCIAMWVWPPAATIFDGATTPGDADNPRSGFGVTPVALTALGAVFTWRGARRRRWLFTWLGVLLFSLAIAEVVHVAAAPPLEAGLLGKEVLRVLGLLFALKGATHEILHTYRDSSTRLARSEYTAMTAQERIRQGEALAEERAHEARSALAAIEGATRTLEHYRDRLPAETQAALATAVSGEIRRLQRLVTSDPAPGDVGVFSLAEMLSPIVASERARDVEVDVHVPGDLLALGRPGSTEQVVQTLFDNARRYAPGKPVTVSATVKGRWVQLRVEDCGPGVPAHEREAIFERGVRGSSAAHVPGSGLGLYVAAQLMSEQSGQLWVEQRAGGGASFVVALPPATDAWRPQQPVDQLRDATAGEAGSSGLARDRLH